ncbi:hypothetical protein ACTXGQ_03075 [Marinobacter sp. 1Y8]
MKRICALSGIALIGLSLSGCFNGSSGGGSNNPDPAPDGKVSFTQFVSDEIGDTRDNRDPVAINDIEFSFNDQTNEQAFDDVLK